MNMKENLKTEYCDYLIKNNLVKVYDVIHHSYTNHRFDNKIPFRNKSCNNLAPTLDTRCDCLGVVVYDR
jgi:hypothetical protein